MMDAKSFDLQNGKVLEPRRDYLIVEIDGVVKLIRKPRLLLIQQMLLSHKRRLSFDFKSNTVVVDGVFLVTQTGEVHAIEEQKSKEGEPENKAKERYKHLCIHEKTKIGKMEVKLQTPMGEAVLHEGDMVIVGKINYLLSLPVNTLASKFGLNGEQKAKMVEARARANIV